MYYAVISTQSRMQVGEQRGHLFATETAIKAPHHAPAHENIPAHRLVRGGSAAGQGRARKEMVQVRRNFLVSRSKRLERGR
jgi:hypothetical protein